jgi:carboxypeptidase family protein
MLRRKAVVLMWAVVGIAAGSVAQTTTGSILGFVSDPSGARCTEAMVKAVNRATGLAFPARTATDGSFVFPASSRPYQLQVRKPGFKTVSRMDLEVHVDEQLHLNLALELGADTDSIEINGAPSALQTQGPGTGTVIGSRLIVDLPLLGRDFLNLTQLVPGITPGAGGNNTNFSVNGQREFGNSILVNGIEVTGNRNNDTNVRPSVDAVLEFKADTSGYPPEFGRSGGGLIAVQTRSGSNQFHGSLFESPLSHRDSKRTTLAVHSVARYGRTAHFSLPRTRANASAICSPTSTQPCPPE